MSCSASSRRAGFSYSTAANPSYAAALLGFRPTARQVLQIGRDARRPLRFDVAGFNGAQAEFQRARDLQSNGILEFKNSLRRLVETHRPDVLAGLRVDQLCGDAKLLAVPLYTAFQ